MPSFREIRAATNEILLTQDVKNPNEVVQKIESILEDVVALDTDEPPLAVADLVSDLLDYFIEQELPEDSLDAAWDGSTAFPCVRTFLHSDSLYKLVSLTMMRNVLSGARLTRFKARALSQEAKERRSKKDTQKGQRGSKNAPSGAYTKPPFVPQHASSLARFEAMFAGVTQAEDGSLEIPFDLRIPLIALRISTKVTVPRWLSSSQPPTGRDDLVRRILEARCDVEALPVGVSLSAPTTCPDTGITVYCDENGLHAVLSQQEIACVPPDLLVGLPRCAVPVGGGRFLFGSDVRMYLIEVSEGEVRMLGTVWVGRPVISMSVVCERVLVSTFDELRVYPISVFYDNEEENISLKDASAEHVAAVAAALPRTVSVHNLVQRMGDSALLSSSQFSSVGTNPENVKIVKIGAKFGVTRLVSLVLENGRTLAICAISSLRAIAIFDVETLLTSVARAGDEFFDFERFLDTYAFLLLGHSAHITTVSAIAAEVAPTSDDDEADGEAEEKKSVQGHAWVVAGATNGMLRTWDISSIVFPSETGTDTPKKSQVLFSTSVSELHGASIVGLAPIVMHMTENNEIKPVLGCFSAARDEGIKFSTRLNLAKPTVVWEFSTGNNNAISIGMVPDQQKVIVVSERPSLAAARIRATDEFSDIDINFDQSRHLAESELSAVEDSGKEQHSSVTSQPLLLSGPSVGNRRRSVGSISRKSPEIKEKRLKWPTGALHQPHDFAATWDAGRNCIIEYSFVDYPSKVPGN